ncbi:MAG: mechanosensitive ion channel [Thermoplasmatota archaeon]
MRTAGRGRSISILLLVLLMSQLYPLLPPVSSAGETRLPLVEGRVVDKETLEGLEDHTLLFERENLIPKIVETGPEGSYNVTLPPGRYTVKVYTTGGLLAGRLVDQRELNITWDPLVIYDFLVDIADMEMSKVSGHVKDKDTDEPIEGCLVMLTDFRTLSSNATMTSKNGSFSMISCPGDHYLTVLYDGELRYNDTITLEWGKDEVRNISIEGEGKWTLVTLDDIRDFLVDHWNDLVVLLVMFVLILILYLLLTMGVNFLKKRFELLEADWYTAIQHFLNRLSVLLALILVTYQLNKMFEFVDEYIWKWMSDAVGSLIGILVVLLASRLLLLGNTRLWDYIRNKRKEGEKKLLPNQIITMLEIVLRYLVFIVSAAVIFVLVLYTFGLKQDISSRISDFFSDNAGRLGFLVILIIAAVLIKRFIDVFFKELGARSTKLSPQLMTLTHKGSVGMVYFIISLIFLFTLLSIGGLGDIGQTLILVISMIVGLVVSFAATGSIGNMLSGLVLMSMRPYSVNDRVEISEIIGDVVALGIMFTTLRDLDGKLHEIPNNNVLLGTITNYTRAVDEGGLAVVVDVSLGYDINPKKARSLMKRAALASPGVLKEKTPRVVVRRFLDHAVEYRLRAYIQDPSNMLHIRSSVMESMLYAFHTEGLEILSPMFHVKREGAPPKDEELRCRTNNDESQGPEESAAEGLTIFDGISDE